MVYERGMPLSCSLCEILLPRAMNSIDSVNLESAPIIDSQYLDLSPVVETILQIFNFLT